MDIVVYRIAYKCDGESTQDAIDTMDAFVDNVVDGAGCNDYDLFLTGHNNFRKKVAKQKTYKGNRKEEKPALYRPLRAHAEAQGAYISEDDEADDMLGMYQTADTCICTIDKDLDMIAGFHYNFNHDRFYFVEPHEADLFFWYQMVMGDSVDNIPGIPGKGARAADNLIEECQADIDKIIPAVKELYVKAYDDGLTVMQEMSDLIWIRRANEIRKIV